ncbi:Rne/Rng family ribonuclease [Cellulomonas sp. URHB0016]
MTDENTPETAAATTTAGGDAAPAPVRRRRASRSAAAPATAPVAAEPVAEQAVVQPAAPVREPVVDAAPATAIAPQDAPEAPRARRSRRVTRTVVTEPASDEPSAAVAAPAAAPAAAGAAAEADAVTGARAGGRGRGRARAGAAAPNVEPAAPAPHVEPAQAAQQVGAAQPAEPAEPTKAPRRRRAGSRAAAPPEPVTAPVEQPLAVPAEAEVETAQPAGSAATLDVRAAFAATAPAATAPAATAPTATPTAGSSTTTDAPSGTGMPRLATTALLFQAPDPSAARPRRRRAQASAGSPEEISEEARRIEREEQEAAEREAAEQARRDAATEQPQEQDDVAPTTVRPTRRRGRRGRGAEGAPSDVEATVEDEAVVEPSLLEEIVEVDVEDAAATDEVDEVEEADEADEVTEGLGGAPRRRRRRGGRGRRTRADQGGDGSGEPEEPDEDADEESDAEDAEGDSEGETGEGAGSSRRRRRRRRGTRSEPGESVGDRPRSTRAASDEVTALRGSTRLEAKRQRRREGRDAGRRRQIISEAEFLARRESVERSMVVREKHGRMQIAVLEDGVLVEHYVSNQAQSSMVGNVYLGRVQNVLPSMEAAFVDVGKGRNAVLYAGEVNWDAAGLDGGQPRRIEQALKSGDSVLVQVTKDPIGHKGARLTSQVTLAGRYLVYVPGGGMTGISRKLPDTERNRLKRILREVVPESAGVIVRTAAEGASEDELRADIARLQGQWEAIEKKSKTASSPALLQGEPDMAIRVVRDIFNDDFSSLVVQGQDAWSTISSYIDELAPDLAQKVSKWTADTDVFSVHRIDEQLAKGMDRKVWLPSGGSLVIDRTEAMTVVDVNTGKFTGSGGTLEETVTRNNLEAAEEIVRQLRLRDIGGIIVIDFIDMVLESNRDLVLRRLVECLGRDRTKHQVAEVTSLGLVQMTRKRVGQGLVEAFSETCEHCHGRGFIVHEEPIEKNQRPEAGAVQQAAPVLDGEAKRSRRKRGGAKEPVGLVPHAVPVLPEAREAVKATLATIAAAAAHAHEHEQHSAPVAVGADTPPARDVAKVDAVEVGAAPAPRLDVFAEFAGLQAPAEPAGLQAPAEPEGPVEELELTAVPADVFEAPTDDETEDPDDGVQGPAEQQH